MYIFYSNVHVDVYSSNDTDADVLTRYFIGNNQHVDIFYRVHLYLGFVYTYG